MPAVKPTSCPIKLSTVEFSLIFIKKKNGRNEGQWFENNPLELVFERENYIFLTRTNKKKA
jgi:hypothetical protein